MPADYHVHRPDESDAHVEKAPDTSPWMTVLVVLAILAAVIGFLIWLTTL